MDLDSAAIWWRDRELWPPSPVAAVTELFYPVKNAHMGHLYSWDHAPLPPPAIPFTSSLAILKATCPHSNI